MLPRSLSQVNIKDRESLKKLFSDLLTIEVKDLSLNLTMSTVTGLADLAEDEIIAAPIPLEVKLL